jgi:hypothetical protein
MPPVGIELTISTDERPQTSALDRAATQRVQAKINPGFPWQKCHLARKKAFRPDTVLKFKGECNETLYLELEMGGEGQLYRSRDK